MSPALLQGFILGTIGIALPGKAPIIRSQPVTRLATGVLGRQPRDESLLVRVVLQPSSRLMLTGGTRRLDGMRHGATPLVALPKDVDALVHCYVRADPRRVPLCLEGQRPGLLVMGLGAGEADKVENLPLGKLEDVEA